MCLHFDCVLVVDALIDYTRLAYKSFTRGNAFCGGSGVPEKCHISGSNMGDETLRNCDAHRRLTDSDPAEKKKKNGHLETSAHPDDYHYATHLA